MALGAAVREPIDRTVFLPNDHGNNCHPRWWERTHRYRHRKRVPRRSCLPTRCTSSIDIGIGIENEPRPRLGLSATFA